MLLRVLLLCSLSIFVFGDHSPAWKHDHEYVYKIRGRIVTGLNQISHQYTGIFLKGKLAIQPASDGHLIGKISHVEYANAPTNLKDGWEQQIPESELNYDEISEFGSKPFKIVMKDGVMDDVIVNKGMSNWQANMIKGVISQLQLNTEAEKPMKSSINIFSQDETNTAVFKTMEKTVTGEAETLYEIHPFPEYMISTSPWLAPLSRPDEKLIEVIKSKNFTHNKENPSYSFGFYGVDNSDPGNTIGEFFSRTSVTRVILSGNLKHFNIQSSVTVDQVTLNPTLEDKRRGLTGSMVNLTIESMKQQSNNFQDVSDPISVGIIYRYDQPFGESNEPQPKFVNFGKGNNDKGLSDEQEITSSESGGASTPEVYYRVQDQPHMEEAPASPLLPFTTGYNGQAINLQQNIKEKIRNLAKSIGRETQEPEHIPRKNTIGKFLMLTSLARVMSYKEMTDVTDQLYTQEQSGDLAAAWIAYRDAVAQAGTGPSLLSIKEWIRKNHTSGFEAAELIATTANSARQPTEKYMKVFYGMMSSEQFMQQQHLNQSLLLSFTNLVHQVYVSKRNSHNKYPVHSFGTFNTAQGRLFVKKEVIPHLSAKLNEAVSNGNTRHIHLYIRALGNVGHRQILSTFKPYLEGAKKASHFQRMLMVIAFDNLVKIDAKVARSVLFKIYQNPRDNEQVRVAAVYQLMRAYPTAAMLQRMAMYTNIDTNPNVNSAVKSAIEALADLQVPRLAKLRAAAESAKSQLSNDESGHQNSKMYLQDYVVEQMNLEVKHILETIGGEDSILPRGIHYWLRGSFGGSKQQIIEVEAMVSSIEDLINVGEQQTDHYRQLLKDKQATEAIETKWSSDYTAKLLNMQNEQREQLEGYLLLHIDALQKVWSFDNNTFESLYELGKQLEAELQSGKHFGYTKMAVYPETAVAFPNAWGLSYIYTYDRPTLTHVGGHVKVVPQSPIYTDKGIKVPPYVDVHYQVGGYMSAKVQSQFGFFAPFNQKRYSSGYDKNLQIYSPQTSVKMHIDIERKQTTSELSTPNGSGSQNVNFLHFSTWPYVSQYEIDNPQPPKKLISQDNPRKMNFVFGERATGIAFTLQTTSDKLIDYAYFYEKLIQAKNDFASVLLGSWLDNDIQHVEINLGINPSRTSTTKTTIHIGHQEKYIENLQRSDRILEPNPHASPVVQASWERQNEFLKKSGSNGINNVHTGVVDAVIEFQGNKKSTYSVTLAGGRSKIDQKRRVLMQFVKEPSDTQNEPVKVYLSADIQVPNPPRLNSELALAFDPTASVQARTEIYKNEKKTNQINFNIKSSKSEQRKEYMKKQMQYHECQKQMKEGNQQLPACEAMTAQANLLDQFSIQVDYDSADKVLLNQTYKLYSIFRHYLYPRISENLHYSHPGENQFTVKAQYSEDLSTVNASINSGYGRVEISNVPINSFYRNVFVPHLSYDIKTRLVGQALHNDAYQPTCVIDKNALNTLDNKTYPISLDKDWVVLFHYVPRRPSPIKNRPELSVNEQLNQQIESYIFYVRAANQNNNSQKEFKIVIQSPNTLSIVTDITLKPPTSEAGYPLLFIQGEKVVYEQKGFIRNDFMEIYKLPNNELYIEVYDAFSMVYDGVRGKLAMLSDKFRDASRGLCGTFTEEKETDFTHPGNCIIHNPEVFVASNTVPEKPRTKRMNDMMIIREEDKKCYQKTVEYATVVSERDVEPENNDKQDMYNSRSLNMRLRHRYVEKDNYICFTIRQVLDCKPSTKPIGYVTKSVKVHCVKNSKMAVLYKEQIDQGSSPDFSHKLLTRTIEMDIPERCVSDFSS